MMSKSIVRFVDMKERSRFYKLENGDASERRLFKTILRARDDLKQNAFCGTQMSKSLIPKEYKKYDVDNLWKYDLPNGWRLIYTVTSPSKVELVTIIIEWFDHKDYEKRFSYII